MWRHNTTARTCHDLRQRRDRDRDAVPERQLTLRTHRDGHGGQDARVLHRVAAGAHDEHAVPLQRRAADAPRYRSSMSVVVTPLGVPNRSHATDMDGSDRVTMANDFSFCGDSRSHRNTCGWSLTVTASSPARDGQKFAWPVDNVPR